MKMIFLSLAIIAQLTFTPSYKNEPLIKALHTENTAAAGLEYIVVYPEQDYDKEKFTGIFKFDDGKGTERVVFWSEGIIKDFKVINVDYVDGDTFYFVDKEIIYHKDIIMPGEAVEFTTFTPCGIPTTKIEYTDEAGTVHEFLLAENGKD